MEYIEKVQIKAEKSHVYKWLHTALIKSIVRNKTRLPFSPFHVSTSWRLTLAGAFRSATEENEPGDYVTVPCPTKFTQHSSTADCLNF